MSCDRRRACVPPPTHQNARARENEPNLHTRRLTDVLIRKMETKPAHHIVPLMPPPRTMEMGQRGCAETERAAAALDVHVGHFSDPASLPGLAHFCEHMLFLGTKAYPDENAYSQYLSAHGGAWGCACVGWLRRGVRWGGAVCFPLPVWSIGARGGRGGGLFSVVEWSHWVLGLS